MVSSPLTGVTTTQPHAIQWIIIMIAPATKEAFANLGRKSNISIIDLNLTIRTSLASLKRLRSFIGTLKPKSFERQL